MRSPYKPGNGSSALDAMDRIEHAKLTLMAKLEDGHCSLPDLFPELDEIDPGYGRKVKEAQKEVLPKLTVLSQTVKEINRQLVGADRELADLPENDFKSLNRTGIEIAMALHGVLQAVARSFSYQPVNAETGRIDTLKDAINCKIHNDFSAAAVRLTFLVASNINKHSFTGLGEFSQADEFYRLEGLIGSEYLIKKTRIDTDAVLELGENGTGRPVRWRLDSEEEMVPADLSDLPPELLEETETIDESLGDDRESEEA